MLLHTGKNEETIKSFFQDVYELYVKVNARDVWLCGYSCLSHSRQQFSMNPFYRYDTPITSAAFDTRVRAIARRYL